MRVAVLFAGLVCLGAARDIDYHCSSGDQYLYATPETQCTAYYKCQQRQVVHGTCDPGAHFNFFQQTCVRTEGVCYESVCSGKANGRYPDTTHACRRYFECDNGRFKSISTCPLGQLFNGVACAAEASVRCGLPENNAIAYPKAATVATTSLCHGLPDGHHSDTTSCQEYLSCAGGELVERLSCGDQGAFDEVARKCIPSALYHCPKQRFQTASSVTSFTRTQLVQEDVARRLDICAFQANGFHVNARLGCRHYVKCSSGRTVAQLECPAGQQFDARSKGCRATAATAFERPLCLNPLPSKDCDRQDNGFYTMPRTECQVYFYCHHGQKTILRCPEGLLFDGRNCVDKGAFECPVPDEACLRPDGYYKDVASGSCRSYFYCANGKKLTYLCAENQAFDGEKCVLREAGTASGCGLGECTNKPDGYYPNLASGCRKYFYCLRGERVTSLTCRDQRVFDGVSCAPAGSVSCGAVRSSQCVPRSCKASECEQDGFFADLEAGCRSYYFCIAGNKTALTCSEGYVFNGESCVSELQYRCPTLCKGEPQC